MPKSQVRNIKNLEPLLIRFKKNIDLADNMHWYDEENELNMAQYKGEKKPVVLIPDSLAMIKTKSGHNED